MLCSKKQLGPLLAFPGRNAAKRTRAVGAHALQESLRVSAYFLTFCCTGRLRGIISDSYITKRQNHPDLFLSGSVVVPTISVTLFSSPTCSMDAALSSGGRCSLSPCKDT